MTRGLALLLAGLALLAGGLAYFWAAAPGTDGGGGAHRLAPDPDCELREGPCGLALGEGRRVSLAIEPRSIPLLRPLRLTARLEGPPPEAITVDIVGLNMEMGLNRTELSPSNRGVWEGETILPVCSRSRMEWEARVRVRYPDGGAPVAPFRFHTQR